MEIKDADRRQRGGPWLSRASSFSCCSLHHFTKVLCELLSVVSFASCIQEGGGSTGG